MIEKEKLEKYAKKLMFEMNEEEYSTLQKEFDIILKQMDLIGKIDNIKDVEPMTFPFEYNNILLREDIPNNNLEIKDILLNAKDVEDNRVKVPKVVE